MVSKLKTELLGHPCLDSRHIQNPEKMQNVTNKKMNIQIKVCWLAMWFQSLKATA